MWCYRPFWHFRQLVPCRRNGLFPVLKDATTPSNTDSCFTCRPLIGKKNFNLWIISQLVLINSGKTGRYFPIEPVKLQRVQGVKARQGRVKFKACLPQAWIQVKCLKITWQEI